VLILEMTEQGDLVVEGLLKAQPFWLYEEPRSRSRWQQPGGCDRVAGVACDESMPASHSHAVSGRGSIPARRHLDLEVGPVDRSGFGRWIGRGPGDGTGMTQSQWQQHEKCLVRPRISIPPLLLRRTLALLAHAN